MVGPAPIYSAADDPIQGESAAWGKFAAARDGAEFWGSWLTILCMQIGRVGGGLLLVGPDAEGAFTPAAVWPRPTLDMQYLSSAAERTLNERRGIVVSADGASTVSPDQRAYVGYPIEVSGALRGAVVLDVAPSPEAALQRTLRLLHWSSAWLVDEFRRRALDDREARLTRTGLVMDLIATAVQERRPVPAAMAVANELASRLECDRVSIGFENKGSVDVVALSHTATFNPKMKLARLIGDAMEEVLDLDVAITYPPNEDDDVGAIAHGELARELRDAAICSAPLLVDRFATGVLTLERGSGAAFDAETVEMVKAAGAVLGPIFALQRDVQRGPLRRVWGSAREGMQALFGPGHPGLKLIALVAAAIVVFFSVTTGTYRVSAKTVVEGAVQRVAAAPFDGYILQADVRAGDTVRKGETLARLDDKDLKLEQTRLMSEREQLLRRRAGGACVEGSRPSERTRSGDRTGRSGFLSGGRQTFPGDTRGAVRRRRGVGRPLSAAGNAGRAGQGIVRNRAARRLPGHSRSRRARHRECCRRTKRRAYAFRNSQRAHAVHGSADYAGLDDAGRAKFLPGRGSSREWLGRCAARHGGRRKNRHQPAPADLDLDP